mgnify:CR=1 FL=1
MDERLVAGVEFQIAGDDLVLKALQDIEDSTRETSERAARAFDEAFDPSKAAAHLARVEAQVRAKFEAMQRRRALRFSRRCSETSPDNSGLMIT